MKSMECSGHGGVVRGRVYSSRSAKIGRQRHCLSGTVPVVLCSNAHVCRFVRESIPSVSCSRDTNKYSPKIRV